MGRPMAGKLLHRDTSLLFMTLREAIMAPFPANRARNPRALAAYLWFIVRVDERDRAIVIDVVATRDSPQMLPGVDDAH
jgi:hypothetical protein